MYIYLLFQCLFVYPCLAGPIIPVSTEPYISSLQVTSKIMFRYSQTNIRVLIKNPGLEADTARFSINLPDTAFISNFSMRVGEGDEVVAKVMKKEEAKKVFSKASQKGLLSGLVSQTDSDYNEFSVSTNLPAGQKVVFTVNYEELLMRRNGHYEHILDIRPGVVVDMFQLEVILKESLPLTSLSVLENIDSNHVEAAPGHKRRKENTLAEVTGELQDGNARILYQPSREQQIERGGQNGLSEKFIISYELDRKNQESEVQVLDGYFVHFYVPDNLEPLPKHVVFILDISGSMSGRKMTQMKDALFTILEDLHTQDMFSIVVFSSDVEVWTSIEVETSSKDLVGSQKIIEATKNNKDIAIAFIIGLSAGGGTNINDALLTGITLAKEGKIQELIPRNTESILVFLTDGEATVGVTHLNSIRDNIKTKNKLVNLPIYCLAFGSGADFHFLKKISLDTKSFAKKIYEGSDAAIQLEDFFSQISSPLISDLKFSYVGGVEDGSVSQEQAGTFFKGSEYVVVGKLDNTIEDDILTIVTLGETKTGLLDDRLDICLRPVDDSFVVKCRPQHPIQRLSEAQQFMRKLYVFVTIQQLIKSDKKEDIERAVVLSLENNLVTEFTSLVVKDGQDIVVLNPEDNLFQSTRYPGYTRSGPAGPTGYNSVQYMYSPASIGQTQMSPSPRSRSRSGSRGDGLRRGGYSSRSKSHNRSGSLSNHYSSSRKSYADVPSISFDAKSPPPTTRAPTGTTTYLPTPYVPTTNIPPVCQVKLYSSTYFREDNVTLNKDMANLEDVKFNDRLVSVIVEDVNCCWEIFSKINYKGDMKKFLGSGSYPSITDIGILFRNAKSARIC